MRILVVTNVYPPHHVGGYELGCRDVVEALRAKGHRVGVLTSTFRLGAADIEEREMEVVRVLQLHLEATSPAHDKMAEIRKMAHELRSFAPEIVFFWNQAGLCLWLPLVARFFGFPGAFFLSDTSFVSWRVGAWLAGYIHRIPWLRSRLDNSVLARGMSTLRRQTCLFASGFLRNLAECSGIAPDPERSAVIHWGIDPTQFRPPPSPRWPPQRLLYVGQMIPQKGVHTALSAFGMLAGEKAFSECSLTLAGGGQNPDYEKQLRNMPAQLGISDRVHFLGRIPRSELPAVYTAHDILIFPSEWDEPFAITPLEAMSSGLIVIGTTTGGSGELFCHRETAMTFATGDAADCARAIRELCADQKLAEAIRERGKNLVTTQYTLASMVDRIEDRLRKLVK